jgi:serine/threonine protein kinase
VLWCGPAIRDGTQIDYKRWLAVGETKHKNKNTDPVFDPKVDNTVFEFPPFWTDMNIPDRGWYVDGVREDYEGGAWCAQNQMPKAPIAKGYLAFGKMKRLFRKVGIVARACIKLLKGPKLEKKRQVTLELDTQRELWRAENRERLCMAREERRNRKWELEIEVNRAKPLLELQIGFEREWSNLCRNILAMPKILARLRFMMGSASDGGGIVIMTEDPATKRMLNVLSVPILYPEDEMFLTGQMGKLIGKQNTNLVGIVDFSVHAARVYNLHGFSGVDERVAIAVLERYEGVMMLDYMKKEWLHMNNDRFRSLLKQIIDGFVGLHEEDIIHRNFHPKAVIVRQPKNIFDEDPNPDKSKRYLPTQPNLRVSEYWFLQNPRKQGCEYSMGRADWGSRITAPPEALGGFLISDRSDIWAFGVCVYHWATGGRTLPPLFKIDDLAKDIPLKWGVWVHALLKMCLAQNPKVRASAKEIQKFLMKMLGN